METSNTGEASQNIDYAIHIVDDLYIEVSRLSRAIETSSSVHTTPSNISQSLGPSHLATLRRTISLQTVKNEPKTRKTMETMIISQYRVGRGSSLAMTCRGRVTRKSGPLHSVNE